MHEKSATFTYQLYTGTNELAPALESLIERAYEARENAYAPYSEFKVGAAVLMDDGTIVVGSNQENAAYPSGLCAERVALFAAKSAYPKRSIQAIAIVTNTGKTQNEAPSPCGSCRQVMLEYEAIQENDITVLLAGSEEHIVRIHKVADLLPFGFTPKDLKKP